MRILKPTALLAGLFLSTLASGQSDAPPKDHKGDYDLRLYCPTIVVRPKYIKDGKGGLVYVPPEYGENPPPVFFIKKNEKEDIQIPLQMGVFGQRVRIDGKLFPGGKIELMAGKIEWGVKPEGAGAKGAGAEGQKTGANTATVTKLPFVNIALEPGKPTLLCLFQSNLKAKWMPPRQLSVDLSPKSFPPGATLLLNLSDSPVAATIGDDAKIVEIPAASSLVLVSGKASADGSFPTKVAVHKKSGYVPLMNDNHDIRPDRRSVLVVTATDPAISAGMTEKAEWQTIYEPSPPKKEAGDTAKN